MLNRETPEVTRDIGLLVFRVVFGGLMLIQHGYSKLTGFSEKAAAFPDPIGVGSEVSLAMAVSAEFFCAALVVVGLATRIAAIPLIITMAVAAFYIHGADPLADKELALLYGTAFLTLFLSGPGRLSLDRVFFGRN
jgi:putative oxidoreductase